MFFPQLPTQQSSSSSEEESDEGSDDEDEDGPPAKDHTTDVQSQNKHVQFSEQVDDLTDTPFAKRTNVRTGCEDGALTDTPKSVSHASGRNSHSSRNARMSLESLRDTPDQRQRTTKTGRRKRLRPAAARGDGDKRSESNKSPRMAKDRVKQRMVDKYSNPFLDLEAVNDDETDTEDEEGMDDGSSNDG